MCVCIIYNTMGIETCHHLHDSQQPFEIGLSPYLNALFLALYVIKQYNFKQQSGRFYSGLDACDIKMASGQRKEKILAAIYFPWASEGEKRAQIEPKKKEKRALQEFSFEFSTQTGNETHGCECVFA